MRVFLIIALVLVLDLACWAAALRLVKRRVWRVLVSVFMAAQMAGLLSMIVERIWHMDWLRETPRALFAAVLLWHFFGLGILLAIGVVRVCAGLVRGMSRPLGLRSNRGEESLADGNSLTRREFLGASAALAPPLFTIGLTGVALAQLNHFRVRRFTLSLLALPRALDGITIAHVSDMHVGRLTSSRLLREMVTTTNALRPDFVLLTGDLINDDLGDLPEAIALVKAMEAMYGLWMIEGNHDLLEDGEQFERRVRAAGVPLLLNDTGVTQVRGYPIQFFGLRWMRLGSASREKASAACLRELMNRRQPEAFPILLAHHPHAFDAAVQQNIPLTLAGHTHGGQLMLDSQHGCGPTLFRYWSGLYARGTSQLIVSNGVGNWFPLRINAPAEIVHLTLKCA